jgi:glycine cleavage system H protein
MTFILVIATAAIIIVFELMRRSRQHQTQPVLPHVTEHLSSDEVVDRYFHPAHTWVMVTKGKEEVTVGADDFSERLVGTLTGIDLPTVGREVRQGDTFAELHHGKRKLTQSAPISGTVVEVNDKLIRKPALLNDSPLEKGWVAKILPSSLDADLRNLLSGATADAWRGAVQAQLIQFFFPKIGTVLQDGGQLVKNVGDLVSDEEWKHLVEQFFPIDVKHPPQNKPTNEGVLS